MWRDAREQYLENRVLSAQPVELIGMLYEGALGSVRDARRHLAAGDIRARAKAISRACEILLELANSLEHQRGGTISARLARLYEYMYSRLIEANMRQVDEPLAEVLGLLLTLSEGWSGVRAPQSVPGNVWARSVAETVGAGAGSHAWSL